MNKVNNMTIQPLFSVLIANYNNGKYLMDAIESGRWKLEKRPLVRIFIQ